MHQGRLTLRPSEWAHARVQIKGIDDGTWKRDSVRFVDVAGDRRKEAVVVISANAGGVGWPNYVLVYDGNGTLLNVWDSGKATKAEPRESTVLSKPVKNTLGVLVYGIQKKGQPACCGTGKNVYRLSKGANRKPSWKLIARS